MVKVELCDEQIVDHINYARQKFLKWATGNATQEVYFTILLQAGKQFYDLPAGVTDVLAYDDEPIQSGGINTLFTIDNMMFSSGFYGNIFWGGYDLVSYHLVQDFLTTLRKYRTTPYNWKYHKSTNQLEINPVPSRNNQLLDQTVLDPNTGVMTEVAVDSPGWVMLRAYMVSGSTIPQYTPAWEDIVKEKKTVVEDIVLTETDIENKYVTLKHKPAPEPSDTTDTNIYPDLSFSVGGLVRTITVDWNFYEYNDRVITWGGLALDGTLVAGDTVTVKYPVLFKSQLYQDEDWDGTKLTDVETEQYRLTDETLTEGQFSLRKEVYDENIRLSIGQIDHQLGVDYEVDADSPNIIRFKGFALESVLEAGDIISASYTTVIDGKPSNPYFTGAQSMYKQYQVNIENYTLTQADVDNKGFTIEGDTVAVGDGVKLSVGSLVRTYNIDYGIINDEINNKFTVTWDGFPLDGSMAVDEQIVISYTSAVPIVTELEEVLYDEDWVYDYVTALSKITLGLIRRKFAQFSSLGNQGIALDGDSLIAEGNTEKEYLEQTLRDEESHEGYGIEIGMFS
jgi:hypothetical protein